MDEQHGESQQRGFWDNWTTPAGQSGHSAAGQQPEADENQPADSGAASSKPPSPPEAPGHSTAFTQPLGLFGAEGPAAGQGQPGGYGQPPGGGYGPPGSYSYPPGGGYGQPPGGYGGGYGTPPPYGRPPRRRRGLTTAITYLAVAALAATAGGLAVSFADSGSASSSPPAASPGSGSGNNGGGIFGNGPTTGNSGASISSATVQKVQKAVEPGIVVINSALQYDGTGVGAAGTGMIISKSGLVLTNNHVIDGTTGLTATVVATGRKYPAKWLGYDKTSDVAVIQIEGASGLSTVPLGNSSSVRVGEDVLGMGNAGGTGNITTVTGTITGVNQTITASDEGGGIPPERLTNMLQTNADIISGDSGGPLASTAGKVIGMDTAASTQQALGFAIPINRAMTIAHQIIAGHSSSTVQIGTTGFIGVSVASGTNGSQSTQASPQAQLQQEEAQAAGQFGGSIPYSCVPAGDNPGVPSSIAPVSAGTLVLGTICGTPAAHAGLTAGDVITSVLGQQVTSPASLMSVLRTVHGGASAPITWVTTSGQRVSRTITVESAPPQ